MYILISILSYSLIGIKSIKIIIEFSLSNSLPGIHIIGLAGKSIRESSERLRSAFKGSGLTLPPKKIIVNLSPSNIKKEGTHYDLGIALGIFITYSNLSNYKNIKRRLKKTIIYGELGLDGTVKNIPNLTALVIGAYEEGIRDFILPEGFDSVLMKLSGIKLYAVKNFLQCVYNIQDLSFRQFELRGQSKEILNEKCLLIDFLRLPLSDFVKRALIIAMVGGHNILLIGPPGSGKSMAAYSIYNLFERLSLEQKILLKRIYSLVGREYTSDYPPLRSPHHTITPIGLVGGGRQLRPGEVTLAHQGVLLLDEIAEYSKSNLDLIRQPIEDKKIYITRSSGTMSYPTDFTLVGTMNPCKCGWYRSLFKRCICSLAEVKNYQKRISGPLLDRFDMIIEIPIGKSSGKSTLTKKEVSNMIKNGRMAQKKRYGIYGLKNGNVPYIKYKDTIYTGEKQELLIENIQKKYKLSYRGVSKLKKLSQTITDLKGAKYIDCNAIYEAIHYRNKKLFDI